MFDEVLKLFFTDLIFQSFKYILHALFRNNSLALHCIGSFEKEKCLDKSGALLTSLEAPGRECSFGRKHSKVLMQFSTILTLAKFTNCVQN